MTEHAEHHEHTFEIAIDRAHHAVHSPELTGTQLRDLSAPPIPADRDLFEVRPGNEDVLVENQDEVRMHEGLRFFTAPGRINPGQV